VQEGGGQGGVVIEWVKWGSGKERGHIDMSGW
jgi:hypothetical protein